MNFSKVNFGENTGLKNDKASEHAPLKYYTSNWFNDPKPENSINFHEGFGKPKELIDNETLLSRSTITNPRVRQDLGSYPIIAGGPMNSSPSISGELTNQFKSCEERDGRFYDKHFYFLKENPNHVQQSHSFRQGVDTRMDTKQIYKK